MRGRTLHTRKGHKAFGRRASVRMLDVFQIAVNSGAYSSGSNYCAVVVNVSCEFT